MMRHAFSLSVLLGLSVLSTQADSCGSTTPDVREVETDGGTWFVSYTPSPDPLPVQALFGLEITVASALDHSDLIEDAQLHVDAMMPSMGHGMDVVPKVVSHGDGTFSVSNMEFSMTGDWEILVDVTSANKTEQAVFTVNCCE